jgi:hypothetical protein
MEARLLVDLKLARRASEITRCLRAQLVQRRAAAADEAESQQENALHRSRLAPESSRVNA